MKSRSALFWKHSHPRMKKEHMFTSFLFDPGIDTIETTKRKHKKGRQFTLISKLVLAGQTAHFAKCYKRRGRKMFLKFTKICMECQEATELYQLPYMAQSL